jgi:hypothetical protein
MASVAGSRLVWQRWKRGANAILRAYSALLLVYLLAVPGVWVLRLFHPVPALEVVLDTILGIVLFVLIPLVVSRLSLDPESQCEAIVARVEPKVDAAAAAAGMNWSESYLSKVSELLRSGQTDRAKAVYRENAGVAWDEADQAMSSWALTRLERKLDMLAQRHGANPNRIVTRPG